MTIRGTSNQTSLTRVPHVVSVLEELGPPDDEGGQGTAWLRSAWTTYVEADNDPDAGGMVFTKGSDHLPLGTPQADAIPI